MTTVKPDRLRILNTARFEGHLEGKKEGLAEGKKEGLAEGEMAGRKGASLDIAIKLRQRGMDYTTIEQLTGVSEEELKD